MNEECIRGTCLCSAVKFGAAQLDGVLGACHCDICRRWSGGPLLAVGGGTDVTVEGADSLTWYRSSERAERAFCSKCGTHLFVRVSHDGRYLIMPGVLEREPEVRFDHQIFVDRKPGYYTFADETANLTSEEVMGGG